MQRLINKTRQRRWLSIARQAITAGERASVALFDGHASLYAFKKDREIVTDADKQTNKAVQTILRKLTPNIPICSEEGGDIEPKKLPGADLTWVLDPIDGTTNYAARLPLWGISLALLQKGEPIIGMISLPSLKQRYHAIKGEGAWFGTHKISASQTRTISDALCLLCYGYSAKDRKNGLRFLNTFSKHARSTRRLGAAVIEAAWIATGRADVSILNGVRPWDIAAGALLVREAGGKATKLNGKPWTINDNDIIMCGPKILPAVLKTIRKR